MQDFKKLLVWKRAHALALHVYGVTRIDPGRAHAELMGQSRRAALSAAAVCAEVREIRRMLTIFSQRIRAADRSGQTQGKDLR